MVLTQWEDIPYPAEEQNKSSPVMRMDGKISVHTSLIHHIPLPNCLQKTTFFHVCKE